MKVNKKNIIIPALMLSVGLGVVGSITGTVAWYQYSSRVSVALLGTSVGGNNKSTEVKVNNGEWKTDYKIADLATALNGNTGLAPVTSGRMAKDGALPSIVENAGTENEVTKTVLHKNPSYQNFKMADWKVAEAGTDYVQYTLSVRAKNIDNSSYVDKDVYLSKVEINDVTTTKDLAKAVRIHISNGTSHVLLAKSADTADISTDVYGYLDLNNDSANDDAKVFEWNSGVANYYGNYTDYDNNTETPDGVDTANEKQTSYSIANPAIVKNPDTASTATEIAALHSFGKTGTTENGLQLTVTVWLEGWQKLGPTATASAMWNTTTYIGEQLQIGLQFAVRD